MSFYDLLKIVFQEIKSFNTNINMNNKIAIVTGAARGIGLATTKLFLEQGWSVAMIDRDEPELKKASEGLSGAMPVFCDVSIPDNVDQMISEVRSAFGRIDALVNNAGVAFFQALENGF